MKNFMISVVVAVLSIACSSSKDETATEDQQHKALYNAVNQPLEKAKDAERQLLDHAAEQRKQAEGL